VNHSLIQKTLVIFSSEYLEFLYAFPENQTRMFQKHTSALRNSDDNVCLAYFLAAVAIGSLQLGDFELETEMRDKHYEYIDLLFSPACGEASVAVVSTHLLLALFSQLTFLRPSFVKHSGLAKVLLSTMDASLNDPNITAGLKYASFYMCDLHEILRSPHEVEITLVSMFLTNFSFCTENFSSNFPFLNDLVDAAKCASLGNTLGNADALHGLIKRNSPLIIPLMTAVHFQKLLAPSQLSKPQIEDSLKEIRKVTHLIVKEYQTLTPLLSVDSGYILQLDVFTFMLKEDFTSAKMLLRIIISGLDFWTLQTSYFLLGNVLVHQVHFLIATVVILGMESEYQTLIRNLSKVMSILQRPKLMPNCLSDCCNNQFQPLCTCINSSPECEISAVCDRLAQLCGLKNA